MTQRISAALGTGRSRRARQLAMAVAAAVDWPPKQDNGGGGASNESGGNKSGNGGGGGASNESGGNKSGNGGGGGSSTPIVMPSGQPTPTVGPKTSQSTNSSDESEPIFPVNAPALGTWPSPSPTSIVPPVQ